MKNPTAKQVQRVIDNLKLIEDAANEGFDMDQQAVQTSIHECGTVHCVGGWYAVALKNSEVIKRQIDDKSCFFEDGADLMAQHLGFRDMYYLKNWAEEKAELWGNQYGAFLFDYIEAYNGLERSSKNPMSIIIKHFEGVKNRIAKLEQTAYPKISHEQNNKMEAL